MNAPRFRWLWKVAGGIAIVLLAISVLTWDSGADSTSTADDRYETTAASVATVDEIVTGSFRLEYPEADVETVVIRTSGVVTALELGEKDIPQPFDHVLDVDGKPVYALVGGTPFYREIRSNTSDGEDIRTLEDNLVAAGYDVGDVDGKADRDLADALREWQEDEDLRENGIFDPASFVWFPDGHAVDELLVDVGGVVSADLPFARLRTSGDLVAAARIEQEDVTAVRVSQNVEIDLDGLPDIDLTGTVHTIMDEPHLDTSDYIVEVVIDRLPDQVKQGMRGDIEILVARHRDVIVVPTGAVGGPSGASNVRVLVDGVAQVRAIGVGLVTPALTVVTSGVAAGDLIIINEREQ